MKRVTLALLVVAILGFAGTSARAAPPSPRPTPTASVGSADPLIPTPEPQPSTDAGGGGGGFLSGMFNRAIGWFLRSIVASALRPVFGLLGHTVLATPAVTDLARVQDIWRITLGIADALIGLFVLAGAGIIMVSYRFTAQRTAREMLPRLVAAATLANASLLLVRVMIGVSNGVSRALLGSASAGSLSSQMNASIDGALAHGVFFLLIALAVIVLAVLVIVAYILRVLVLLIAVVAAPLFLVTYALPQGDEWGRMWWRVIGAVLLIPVTQSLLLSIAMRIVLTQSLTGHVGSSTLIDLLMIAGILFLAFKIPFFMLQKALATSSTNGWRRMQAEVMAMAAKAAA